MIAVFVLAFVARLLWAETVLSPFDSIYSDMEGYVSRADALLDGSTPGDPRLLALFPPGTHTILAIEFRLFGRNAVHTFAVVHSLVDALPAPLCAALILRLIPSLWAAAAAGLAVAFWYPHVAYVGFFSSEVWFSALVVLQTWLAARPWARTRSLLLVGMATAATFVVRPQFLLTWGLQMIPEGYRFVFRRRRARTFWRIVCFSLPLALMIGVTATRFHRLSGHWGLIAESAGTRLWADTDVCKIESHWQTPDGGHYEYWFSPPSKPAVKPSDTVSFEGYIVDPHILDQIRRERLRGVSLRDRVARRIGNIELLLVNNLPWPESNYHDDVSIFRRTDGVSRHHLLEDFRDVLLYAGLPFCLWGLLLGKKNWTLYVLATNLFTIVFTAAFFFGEARYLIPYDPFILLLAVVGCHEVFLLARNAASRVIRTLRMTLRSLRGARRSSLAVRSQVP